MNVLAILLISVILFLLSYFIYGSYISKLLGINPKRKTPAAEAESHHDYVPTHPQVLLGHHFASIAGAGPIVGPTIALFFGYVPLWLWILIGAIFFGAVHDFTALFVSIREGGKSMAEVTSRTMGKTGFILFILFTIVMIVLVTSAFLGLTAKALTSLAPLSMLELGADQVLLKTELHQGVLKARIGGIASTSVIIMTLVAPLLGLLLYRTRLISWIMTIIASAIAIIAIIIGFNYPLSIDPKIWMVILSVYAFIAAGIPVWIILQPRDFTNVHILYAGMSILIISIIAAGIKGVSIIAPAFNIAEASGHSSLGYIFPVLFITVACGAISGFHALVSSGTSSKQIRNEGEGRLISYGSMLLEGLLAVCVFIAVGAGLKFADYRAIVFPAQAIGSNPILAFSMGVGNILKMGLNIPTAFGTILGILMVEGFVITSLDTAVRLNRYLFEELWFAIFKNPPAFLKSYLFNSGLSVVIMFFLAVSNAYITIWPIFGTANQLLAALTLTSVSAWLLVRRKPVWITIIPAIFMLVTTLISLLLLLFQKYIPSQNYPLIAADLLLLILATALVAKASDLFTRRVREKEGLKPAFEKEEEDLVDEFHLG